MTGAMARPTCSPTIASLPIAVTNFGFCIEAHPRLICPQHDMGISLLYVTQITRRRERNSFGKNGTSKRGLWVEPSRLLE